MTRGWTRPVVAGLLIVLGAGGVAVWAKPGTVTTRNGQTFEGDVTEKGDTVVVMTKGNIPVTINRANVSGIEYAGSVKEQFDGRMKKLGKEDSAGRVELAQWALEKQEYDLSLDALDAALAIDKNNEDARRLQRAVLSRRSLQRAQAAKSRQAGGPQEAGQAESPEAPADGQASTDAGTDAEAQEQPRPAAARQRADAPPAAKGEGRQPAQREAEDDRPEKLRMVTAAEINRIRQMELQKGEKVRVSFQNDVKQRYLASSDIKPQEFNKLTPPEQAREILSNGAEGLHRDVTVATDPATLAQFKANVQRYLLPGCAAAACHGGPDAGRFTLHNPAAKDPEAYTNFLLLQRYRTTIDDKEYSMIDRARPEDSLLLLMGLPPRDAAVPHPEVKNFRPLYKGKNDRTYQGVLTWMEEALGPVQPDYDIDLTKPAEEEDGERPARRSAEGGRGGDGGGEREMKDAGTGRPPRRAAGERQQ